MPACIVSELLIISEAVFTGSLLCFTVSFSPAASAFPGLFFIPVFFLMSASPATARTESVLSCLSFASSTCSDVFFFVSVFSVRPAVDFRPLPIFPASPAFTASYSCLLFTADSNDPVFLLLLSCSASLSS